MYTGILPDLFKEGKGVVAQGRLGPDGVFQATEVLAKHDENYMPPEAAHALEQGAKAQKTHQVQLRFRAMIPEIGQFALILALLLALAQGMLPIAGAHRGIATLDGARAAGRTGPVPVRRDRVRVPRVRRS